MSEDSGDLEGSDGVASIFSPGSVYFEKGQDAGLCSVNHVACIPHLAACVPDLPPFSYQDL